MRLINADLLFVFLTAQLDKERPVDLSVELNGCAFALRAPNLEAAARVHACAGKLLEDMRDSFTEKRRRQHETSIQGPLVQPVPLR